MFNFTIITTTMLIFTFLVNSCGCLPDGDHQPGENETGTPEIVGAVADKLFHWFSHEIALGARVFRNYLESNTYYAAIAGKQSVTGCEINIVIRKSRIDKLRSLAIYLLLD